MWLLKQVRSSSDVIISTKQANRRTLWSVGAKAWVLKIFVWRFFNCQLTASCGRAFPTRKGTSRVTAATAPSKLVRGLQAYSLLALFVTKEYVCDFGRIHSSLVSLENFLIQLQPHSEISFLIHHTARNVRLVLQTRIKTPTQHSFVCSFRTNIFHE